VGEFALGAGGCVGVPRLGEASGCDADG